MISLRQTEAFKGEMQRDGCTEANAAIKIENSRHFWKNICYGMSPAGKIKQLGVINSENARPDDNEKDVH